MNEIQLKQNELHNLHFAKKTSNKGKIGELTINLNQEVKVQIENSKISFSTNNLDTISMFITGDSKLRVLGLHEGNGSILIFAKMI